MCANYNVGKELAQKKLDPHKPRRRRLRRRRRAPPKERRHPSRKSS